MATKRKTTGHMGEQLAISLLKKSGYRILDTNFHASNRGEIDIIAAQGDVLVFVEVKTRRTSRPGLAEEAVDSNKLDKLALAAEIYLAQNKIENREYRIDVVAIGLGQDNKIIYQNILTNVTI